MQQLTLQQLFGARAYQDSDRLVINKGDLFNLSASATNTAESLLVAIVINACRQFEGNVTDELDRLVTDQLNHPITYNNSKLFELLNVFYWNHQYITSQNTNKILDTFVVEEYAIQSIS